MKQFSMSGAVKGAVKGAGLMVGLMAMISLVGLMGASNARANNVISDITDLGGTTFFGARHTDNLDFTDVFTFTIPDAVNASVSLVTIGSGANNIDFLNADLNGIALTFSATGFLETGSLDTTTLTGPLVLTVRGRSDAAGGTFAAYSGTMNVAVIPEPSTALLMGFGLGGLGLAARRTRA